MLALEVHFLTGRYVATAYHSREQSEWPPHPARLYSALVATHFEVEDPPECERRALEWLESAPPPEIAASAATERDRTTVFVPVNDTFVVKGIERQELRLLEAEEGGGTAEANARGRRSSALARTRAAIRSNLDRAMRAPESSRKTDAEKGRAVLPETRTRQARSFPSVTPIDPRVTYVWSEEPPSEVRRALESLVERVVRLGHSSSLVSLRLVDEAPRTRLRPAPEGEEVLRVAQPGQLRHLESAHSVHRGTEPRVMPCRHAYYTEARVADETPALAFARFTDRWLVLRRVDGPTTLPSPRLPITATVGLARAVRGALMHHAEDPVPRILSGHEADGRPTAEDHLAFVPLPVLGDSPDRGSLLGVALVLPRSGDEADRRAVARALERWESAARRGGEDAPAVPVLLGRAGVMHLRRVDGDESAATLDPETWCEPATAWLSVTPVALDRHPGALWSRDPAARDAALAQARASIARSCERLGLPRPLLVEPLPRAPLSGTAAARHYPAYPESRTRSTPRRMLTHARVVFSSPVRGPLLLGAGRYFGLGLMRPADHER